jgi:hypothetical protein
MQSESDPVSSWLEKDITPAIEEASILLYEFSRLELRDVVKSHEYIWKLVSLNHRIGILYADAVELRNEFQTQCDELSSQAMLMLGAKSEYKLSAEAARAAGDLATSNMAALDRLYPAVARVLKVEPGDEPRRKLNRLSSTVEKLRSVQRDMQESINGIKHLGNRELQHAVHGL